MHIVVAVCQRCLEFHGTYGWHGLNSNYLHFVGNIVDGTYLLLELHLDVYCYV